MSEPKFCKDCRHSMLEPGSEWNLVCQHPRVLGKNPWALARPSFKGTPCTDERRLRWPAPCGMRGALWAPKEVPGPHDV